MSIFITEFKKPDKTIQKKLTSYVLAPVLEPTEEATNKARITIKGNAQQGNSIEIFLNGSSYKKLVADKKGDFSTSVTLNKGNNRILAIAKDKDGNESVPSETLYISLKTSDPKLIINDPQNGQKFEGEDNKKIIISGETDPENTLYLNERLIIIQSNGSFNYALELKEGDNTLKFLAQDNAGNETEKEITVSFTP